MSLKSKNSRPLISVITPAYNAEKYISETIASVLRQNEDFEYLIVNDGSNDRTEELIRSFKDPRIICINQENGGVSLARNRAIRSSKGKYVISVDSDDLLGDSALTHKSRFLEENSNVDIAVGNTQYINDNGTLSAFGERNEYLRPMSQVQILVELLLAQNFPDNQLMWRRKALLKIKGYVEKLRVDEDIEILLTALHSGLSFGFIDPITGYYRISKGSLTRGEKGRMGGRFSMPYWPRSPQKVANILFADNMIPVVSKDFFVSFQDEHRVALISERGESKSIFKLGEDSMKLIKLCVGKHRVSQIIGTLKQNRNHLQIRLALYNLFLRRIIDIKGFSANASTWMGAIL